MNFSNYPILKILIPYIFGTLLAYFATFSTKIIQIFAFIIPIIIPFLWGIYKKMGYKWQWIPAVLLQISFVLVGIISLFLRFSIPINPDKRNVIHQNKDWLITVIDYPIEKEKSVKVVATLNQTLEDKIIGYKAILYFKKDESATQIEYGDILLIHCPLKEVEAPKNPFAFNNQQFLKRKGIYFTGYIRENSWKRIGSNTPNIIKEYSYKVQHYFTELLAKGGMSGDEYGIITAILLGDDDTLEPDLKATYSAAGVSHILCVSGMHVGIIYMILNFILKPLDLFRRTSTLKSILLMAAIWAYAHITGLSPSVSRAATMFSFVSIGSLLNRNTNIYHSLYASLFLLLLYNPLLIFELGFQLSYLAVFGIVIFQKPLESLYAAKTKVGKYVWQLCTVSIAAQIITSPISIFHFGQFPNYFLLSNLSVISLSFMVVVTGVGLLIFSFWPLLANLIGKLLTGEIKIMNFLVESINNLPGSVSHNLSLTVTQVLILYLFIFVCSLLLQKRSKYLFYVLIVLSTSFWITFSINKVSDSRRMNTTIYAINKQCAFNFTHGNSSILLTDSIESKDDKQYKYNIFAHERKERINSIIVRLDTPHFQNSYFYKEKNWVLFNGHCYYFLSGEEKIYAGKSILHVDYLCLYGNAKVNLANLMGSIHFKTLIIDESNSQYYEKRWINYCKENGIDYRSTREQGAIIIRNGDFSTN